MAEVLAQPAMTSLSIRRGTRRTLTSSNPSGGSRARVALTLKSISSHRRRPLFPASCTDDLTSLMRSSLISSCIQVGPSLPFGAGIRGCFGKALAVRLPLFLPPSLFSVEPLTPLPQPPRSSSSRSSSPSSVKPSSSSPFPNVSQIGRGRKLRRRSRGLQQRFG